MKSDFEFDLDEKVLVGTQPAIVIGAAAFTYKHDEFLLRLIDDDGLPFERWFTQDTIEKARLQ